MPTLLKKIFLPSVLFTLHIYSCNSETVVQVKNYKISDKELGVRLNLLALNEKQTDEKMKKSIAVKLLNDKIVESLAKKEGLDKEPAVEAMLQSILVNEYIKKHYDIEKIAKDNYAKAKEFLKNKKNYQLSHILLEDEARANDLYGKIKNNKATFKKFAKDYSTDAETASNGGFIGLVSELAMSTDFLANIKNKPKDVTLEPFKTNFGYHIVIIEKIEPMTIEPYESLQNILIPSAIEEQIVKVAEREVEGEEVSFVSQVEKVDKK